MTMQLATDPETRVRVLTPSFSPRKTTDISAAESRERNRLHIAAMQEAQARGEAARAEQAAQAAREGKVSAPSSVLPEPHDDAGRRKALGAAQQALTAAQEAEHTIVNRISAAVREKSDAEARHALARGATATAQDAAAQATKTWIANDCQGGRPDMTGAVAAAVTAEAMALADTDVMTAALDALRLDHEAAQTGTKQAQAVVAVAVDRIISAYASELAAKLAAADKLAAELRQCLSAFCRSVPVSSVVPASVKEAMPVQHVPVELYGSVATAETARWSRWRAALMLDPQAEFPAE